MARYGEVHVRGSSGKVGLLNKFSPSTRENHVIA